MKSLLSRFKWFGLRYIYYRVVNRFPLLRPRLADVFDPHLVSRYYSALMIDKYYGLIGHGVDEKNRSYVGLGMINYDLIRTSNSKRILCIGSYRGFIPAVCASACRDNKKGVVDFVDVGMDFSNKNKLLGDGYWKKASPDKVFGDLFNNGYIRVHVMTSDDFKKINPKRHFDYIYIDGDHTYKQVKKDYENYWPMLEKGGYMVFHDILGKSMNDVDFGVGKLWKEIKNRNKIQINFPNESGLGILQK